MSAHWKATEHWRFSKRWFFVPNELASSYVTSRKLKVSSFFKFDACACDIVQPNIWLNIYFTTSFTPVEHYQSEIQKLRPKLFIASIHCYVTMKQSPRCIVFFSIRMTCCCKCLDQVIFTPVKIHFMPDSVKTKNQSTGISISSTLFTHSIFLAHSINKSRPASTRGFQITWRLIH